MMTRNLFLCCDEKDRERFTRRVKSAYEESVDIVADPADANFILVIGKVSPDMQRQIDGFRDLGIKTSYVNENLINEKVYERIQSFAFRGESRER